VLTVSFEARQERRAAEIADLENRIAKLKELHKKREDLKKTIIANRLRQLLEDTEGLGWGDEASSGPTGNFLIPGMPGQAMGRSGGFWGGGGYGGGGSVGGAPPGRNTRGSAGGGDNHQPEKR
jgi:hypothetical protein